MVTPLVVFAIRECPDNTIAMRRRVLATLRVPITSFLVPPMMAAAQSTPMAQGPPKFPL